MLVARRELGSGLKDAKGGQYANRCKESLTFTLQYLRPFRPEALSFRSLFRTVITGSRSARPDRNRRSFTPQLGKYPNYHFPRKPSQRLSMSNKAFFHLFITKWQFRNISLPARPAI
jgi:hypothetical protein